MADPHRRRFPRVVLFLAAGYNVAFGAWAILRPVDFFALFDLPMTNHPAIWRCLGMVLGVYGAGYAWAAVRPDLVQPVVVLGPIGWAATVASGEWPLRTFPLVLFNDLVWWIPFVVILRGARAPATSTSSSPPRTRAGAS